MRNKGGFIVCVGVIIGLLLPQKSLSANEIDTLLWKAYSVHDGMPNNHVLDITQDSKGFIWVGTTYGLARFDGYNFKTFENKPNDSTSLSSDQITCIFEDSKNNLWVGTTYGLNRLQINGDRFDHYFQKAGDFQSLAFNSITKIFEADGDLWIGTKDGTLHLWDPKSNRFIRVATIPGDQLSEMIYDQKSRIWVGMKDGSGVFVIDKKSGKLISHEINQLTRGLRIFSLFLKDNELWIGSGTGLFRYREGSGKLVSFEEIFPDQRSIKKPSNIFFDIYESKDGKLLVGTDGGGLLILDLFNKSFSWNDTFASGLNSLAITRVFQDKDGVFWLGTVNAGLGRERKLESIVTHYTFDKGNETGLSGNFVTSIHESKNGNIWIGLDQGGVNYFDRQKGKFVHYIHDPDDARSLPENIVNRVYEDAQGDLFAGTYQKGFGILKKGSSSFEPIWNTPNSNSPSHFIRDFLEDSQGDFWIGTVTGGLVKYDKTTGKWWDASKLYEEIQGLTSNHIISLSEDSDQNIWIGTIFGLNQWNRKSRELKTWIQVDEDVNSLLGNMILCLFEDSSGQLWIGTDQGLNKYLPEQGIFERFGIEKGLPSKGVKTILEGNPGELWTGTSRGIYKFDQKDKTFEPLNIEGGNLVQSYSWGGLQSKDGTLWFGTTSGIYSFHPKNIKKNPIPPNVYISELSLNNQVVVVGEEVSPLTKSLEDTETMELDYAQSNVISFKFTALNFVNPSKNQYAYIMEGFEDDWTTSGNQRVATYTNLNPGTYTFRVRASNNDGVWNQEGASLKITILPPWWKTTPALFLWFFLLILIAFGIWYSERLRLKLRHKLKIAELEKEKEIEISQAKAQFFTNISHEFKTPLTLILGPLERMVQDQQINKGIRLRLRTIEKNAKRLLDLVTQFLDFRKLEEGKLFLQAKSQDIVHFAKETVRLFEDQAQEKKIRLDFIAEEESLLVWFDERKLDKVLFNLLSNAFRHTLEGGKIDVTVRRLDSNWKPCVEIFVEDSGVGIPASEQSLIFERFYQVDPSSSGTGIGLALSKSLIKLHHGEILLESTPGKGSCFTIQLPLGNEHLKPEEMVAISDLENPDNKVTSSKTIIKEEESLQVEYSSQREISTILLVEDDLELSSFIQQVLKDHDFDVLTAADGQEGLDKAIRNAPDLIISDVLMPKLNGFDLSSQLKSNFMTSHIPLILLTSLSEEEDYLKGFEVGIDQFITKPFSERILISRIKGLLANRRKLHDFFQIKTSLDERELQMTAADELFLEKTLKIIDDNIENPDFNVESLAQEMAMSRSVFFKKMKSFVGLAPNEFIQIVKLKKAEAMLIKQGLKVSEVAFQLGFTNPKTFRTQFKKFYGQTPTDYIQNHQP